MLDWVLTAESRIEFLLVLGAAVMEIVALFDVVIRPSAAFAAAGKLSKPAWILILALALLSSFAIRTPLSILVMLGIAAAGVYLADARPALKEVTRR